jgi:tRNA A37 N6-isopentenylltransferase MiaA
MARAMRPTFRARAIAATRQLAKRQLTWLRGELDARWFDPRRSARNWTMRSPVSSASLPP